MNEDLNKTRAISLRDFFLAADGGEMAKACEPLLDAGLLEPATAGEWRELEFAFNRLFVGPRELLAPPYASVYLEDEPYVMGESTRRVRSLYETISLISPWRGQLPDDHVSLELDAVLQLREAIAKKHFQPLLPVYQFLLETHMNQWIPLFAETILGVEPLPEPMRQLTDQLQQWLKEEMAWLAEQAMPEPETLSINEESHL